MRILLITSAYNSLTQRMHTELTDRGHEGSGSAAGRHRDAAPSGTDPC